MKLADQQHLGAALTEGRSGELVHELPGDPNAPSPHVVFALVGIGLFMTSVDLTIVATALHAIQRNLHATINWAGWTITIYGLCTVVALPIAGKFCGQFGQRRVFMAGVAVFTATSLACGFCTDIYMLIVFRALQALGGGAIQPAAAGLVAEHYGKGRARAISLFAVVGSVGQVVGPIAGGVVVGYLSWRWIFFVNVPFGVGLLIATLKFIPPSRTRTDVRTDIRGLLLMAFGILSAIFAVTDLGDGRTSVYDPSVLIPAVIAVTLIWAFFHHERRVESPFIPLKLLQGKGFSVMNWINLLHGSMTFGIMSLSPLYAENRFHVSVLDAGTLLTSRAVGVVAIGSVSAFALRRTGYRLPMRTGFIVIAVGTVLMSVSPRWGISPFLWLSFCAGIAGCGLGAVNPAASNAGIHLAPDQAAAITGLRSMFINLGVIVSVSITTAILNRSSDPGVTQSHVFWVVGAIVCLVIVPLVSFVPEHRGDW